MPIQIEQGSSESELNNATFLMQAIFVVMLWV